MAINNYHEIEIKNGNYLPIKFTPAEYSVDYQSLVGPDSGRTMDGTMVISDWYLRRTTKLTVKLPPHNREDPLYSRVFSYVQGQEVKVSYYDYLSHTYKSEIEMYCSETSMGWSYKGLVNDASFELIEMKGDKTVTPVTSTTQYTITATVSPSGSGAVTGAGTFYQGATCVLVATPATGYHFSHWGSNTADTNPTKSFTVSSNASYTAYFVADTSDYWDIVWKDSLTFNEEEEGGTSWDVTGSDLSFDFKCNNTNCTAIDIDPQGETYYTGIGEVYDDYNTQVGWIDNSYKTIRVYQDPSYLFVDQDWGSFLSTNALSITHHTE